MSLHKNLLLGAFSLCASVGIHAQKASEIVCPNSVNVKAETGQCGAHVCVTNPFTCDALEGFQTNTAEDSWYKVGEESLYFKGADKKNKTHFCLFKVKVLDMENPTVQKKVSDVYLKTAHPSGAVAEWETPTMMDNCSEVKLVSSHESGSLFPVGTTEVTYTGYDAAGNVSLHAFNVHVQLVESLVEASR